VTRAVNIILAEPKYGFYVSACVDEKIAGSFLVTLEYNYIKDRTIYWIMSVFTEASFRNQGVYKSSHRYIAADAKSTGAQAIKLYVELDNSRGQATYKKLGMEDNGEEMYEIDLAFRSSKNIDASSYKYADKEQLQVKRLNIDLLEEIRTAKFKHVMGEKGTSINFTGLTNLLREDALGEALVVEKQGKVLSVMGIFYEYSEWRDAVLYYIYDIRINDEVENEELENVTAVVLEKVCQSFLERRACGIRLMMKSEYPWMGKALMNIGFLEPHYYIYETLV